MTFFNMRQAAIITTLASSAACLVAAGWLGTSPALAQSEGPAIQPLKPEVRDGATTKSTKQPTTTSAPAVKPPSEEVMKVLKALEAAGDKYATINSDVTYELVNRVLGEKEVRTGWIAYQKADEKKPPMFRVSFDKLIQEGAPQKEEVDYAFDGYFLTTRKPKIKQMIRYQVAVRGQKVQPLKLGRSPFPLPFGQKVDDMVRFFQITTRKPFKRDPDNTVYLKLLPRKSQEKNLNFTRLEMWIDKKTHLPVKAVSYGKDKNRTTVEFEDLQLNKDNERTTFRLPMPPAGWEFKVVPLDRDKPKPDRN
ncbi:MAG: LolA family protein [Phycisphaerae bacterium]